MRKISESIRPKTQITAITERNKNMNEQTLQSTIYIGLNDSVTGEQKFDTEKYL